MQRGYLSSRDILLNSLFGEANRNNAGATMVWEWIAWNSDDSSYSFDTNDDGSNGMRAQINYMRSKVPPHIFHIGVCSCVAICWVLLHYDIGLVRSCSFACPLHAHLRRLKYAV